MMLEHQEDFPLESITLYDNDEERQAVIGDALAILMREEAPQVTFSLDVYKRQGYDSDLD